MITQCDLRLKPIFETISFLFNSFDYVLNDIIPFVYIKKRISRKQVLVFNSSHLFTWCSCHWTNLAQVIQGNKTLYVEYCYQPLNKSIRIFLVIFPDFVQVSCAKHEYISSRSLHSNPFQTIEFQILNTNNLKTAIHNETCDKYGLIRNWNTLNCLLLNLIPAKTEFSTEKHLLSVDNHFKWNALN